MPIPAQTSPTTGTTPQLGGGEASSTGPRLLVAIPALNEERTISDVIRRLPNSLEGIATIDVVVIDDGSVDRTNELAVDAGAHVIRHVRTRGVGGAFHSALAHGIEVRADLIVTIDGDGQFDPADIAELIQPVLADQADFTTASRFKDPELTPHMPAIKLWGNSMMSRLISRLTGQKFYDVSCGMRCYHRRAALQLCLLARFTYTQEVFLNLAFRDLRISEVPIRVRGEREFGKSRVAGSVWRYALRTAHIILRSYRDYQPLRFFGGLALALLGVATSLGSFFGFHYLQSGQFHPHTWAGVCAGAAVVLAVMMIHMGVIGDMLNRHRIYLEELLYLHRGGRDES